MLRGMGTAAPLPASPCLAGGLGIGVLKHSRCVRAYGAQRARPRASSADGCDSHRTPAPSAKAHLVPLPCWGIASGWLSSYKLFLHSPMRCLYPGASRPLTSVRRAALPAPCGFAALSRSQSSSGSALAKFSRRSVRVFISWISPCCSRESPAGCDCLHLRSAEGLTK